MKGRRILRPNPLGGARWGTAVWGFNEGPENSPAKRRRQGQPESSPDRGFNEGPENSPAKLTTNQDDTMTNPASMKGRRILRPNWGSRHRSS